MLSGLDSAHLASFGTPAAMRLPASDRELEHVVPVKRIIIETIA